MEGNTQVTATPNDSPDSRQVKSSAAQDGAPGRAGKPKFQGNRQRTKDIEELVQQVQRAKLTPWEMLTLLNQLGITPLYSQYRDKSTKQMTIRFLENPGKAQMNLLTKLGSLLNNAEFFRRQFFTFSLPMTLEQATLLQQLNASGYTGKNGLTTPQLFQQLEAEIERLAKMMQTELGAIKASRNKAAIEEKEKRDKQNKQPAPGQAQEQQPTLEQGQQSEQPS